MTHYTIDQRQPLQTGSPNKSINKKSRNQFLNSLLGCVEKVPKHILPQMVVKDGDLPWMQTRKACT